MDPITLLLVAPVAAVATATPVWQNFYETATGVCVHIPESNELWAIRSGTESLVLQNEALRDGPIGRAAYQMLVSKRLEEIQTQFDEKINNYSNDDYWDFDDETLALAEQALEALSKRSI